MNLKLSRNFSYIIWKKILLILVNKRWIWFENELEHNCCFKIPINLPEGTYLDSRYLDYLCILNNVHIVVRIVTYLTCFCCSKWSIFCDKICSFEIFMVWLLFTTYINHYIWSKYRRKWVFLELVLLWLHFTNSMPRKHTLESKSI